jgi:predicted Fe-Mo cluster-binding NifX family protein
MKIKAEEICYKTTFNLKEKDNMIKKIMVASEDHMGLNSQVSSHFGRCTYYTLVELEDNKIKKITNVENPYYSNHGQPGQVPNFINQQGAEVIIAGGMGPQAIKFFKDFKIETVTGANGRVADVVNSYLKGDLKGTKPCSQNKEI